MEGVKKMDKEYMQRIKSILGGLVLFHEEIREDVPLEKLNLLTIELERLCDLCKEAEGGEVSDND